MPTGPNLHRPRGDRYVRWSPVFLFRTVIDRRALARFPARSVATAVTASIPSEKLSCPTLPSTGWLIGSELFASGEERDGVELHIIFSSRNQALRSMDDRSVRG